MEEEWRVIKEAPNCKVSNFGNVRVEDRNIITKDGKTIYYKEKEITKSKKQNGYLEVALPVKKGKRIYRLVHRLVLMTFNPVDNMDKLEVNHIDENKENNCLENLEWVTSKENCNYRTRNKRVSKNKRVKIRCVETGVVYNSMQEAADKTGLCKSSICNSCKGKISYVRNKDKKSIFKTLHWEYVNEEDNNE